MSMIERRRRVVPGLNTASLPDLIFTVLFFFMIVTHMRTETVKVDYRVPQGSGLAQLQQKSSVVHVYVGKSKVNGTRGQGKEQFHVQVGDRIVPIESVADCIREIRSHMPAEEARRMTVSLKADADTPMGLVAEVKQALREAKALRVNYSGDEKKSKKH